MHGEHATETEDAIVQALAACRSALAPPRRRPGRAASHPAGRRLHVRAVDDLSGHAMERRASDVHRGRMRDEAPVPFERLPVTPAAHGAARAPTLARMAGREGMMTLTSLAEVVRVVSGG